MDKLRCLNSKWGHSPLKGFIMLEQAMLLLNEHRKEYMFYSNTERYKFHRRLRRLASKIDCNDVANAQARLVLDVVATRCNVQILFSNE